MLVKLENILISACSSSSLNISRNNSFIFSIDGFVGRTCGKSKRMLKVTSRLLSIFAVISEDIY